jgi:hypothetical protein
MLRELSLALHSPALALASQKRSAGNYGGRYCEGQSPKTAPPVRALPFWHPDVRQRMEYNEGSFQGGSHIGCLL